MRFRELDTVVLTRDVPEHGLRKGDIGAVVSVYDSDHLEIEFVAASGVTEALVTLKVTDLREASDDDVVATRSRARGTA